MSGCTRFPTASSLLLACMLAAATASTPASLAAQQDTGMMQHDSAMMDHGRMMGHDNMSMDHDDAMDKAPSLMFMGAAGHKAAGDYAISDAGGKRQLELTDDFAVTPRGDLYLVLANGPTPDGTALYLGKLKQATGAQAYDLPKGRDLSGYTTLLVWSKKEKRAVASAEWHASSGGMMKHM